MICLKYNAGDIYYVLVVNTFCEKQPDPQLIAFSLSKAGYSTVYFSPLLLENYKNQVNELHCGTGILNQFLILILYYSSLKIDTTIYYMLV